MYSYEERLKAVQLYIQYDKSYASVFRELGYQSSMNTPNFRIPRVQTIEEESFSNIAARIVQIPSSVTSIESKAFASNNRLLQIYIPAAVQSIAPDAFSGTYGFTIFGAADSYAENFALEKVYTFIPLS